MIQTLLLIFCPARAWDRIARARRGVGFVCFLFLLPLLLLTAVGEVAGLIYWGKSQGILREIIKLPPSMAVHYGLVQVLLSVAAVFVGATLIEAIGGNYHVRHSYRHAFAVVAYALGPLFLLRLLNLWPGANSWVCWGIGMVFSLAVLHRGLLRLLRPDLPQALGLYFMSAVLLVLTTGLGQLVASQVLRHQFTLSPG